MINRFIGGTAALALTLTLGAGVAHAAQDTRPVRGSTACSNQVVNNPDVVLANTAVATAQDNYDQAVRQNLSDAVQGERLTILNQRKAALDNTTDSVTARLCKNRTTEPTTTTPAPTTVVQNPTTVVQRPTTVVERPAPIMIRPERTVEVRTVVPTADDGSVAVTSGSQVTVAPEGSASTGSL